MGSLDSTPDYGRRLIPTVIDEAAERTPDHIVYTIPLTSNPLDGFREISHKTFANAVNRAAWWLKSTLGISNCFDTIGYMGINDLRYQILCFSAIKVGYKMLFNSPRNSLDGHLGVIDAADCKIWCIAPEKNVHVEQILSKRAMRVIFLPTLDSLLHESLVDLYPFTKSFEEAKSDPILVLHTSGSTGLPKPIFVVQWLMSTVDAFNILSGVGGKQMQLAAWKNLKFLSTFPPFHSAGLTMSFYMPFYNDISIVLPSPDTPVNQKMVNSVLDTVDIQGAFLAPSTVEEMAFDPDSFERVKKLKFVVTGGGPVSKLAGDKIMTVSKLENSIGVTEGTMFPVIQSDPEDWQYFHYHPAAGFEYRLYGDGLYEQVQVRNPELELFQGFFKTFPDLDEYHVRDLYEKHPTKPNKYLYRGRADDVIVLNNGEKVNPLDMEKLINDHEAVKATLVVGQARFQTAVIVELVKDAPESPEERIALLKSLWETVQKANDLVPKHGEVQEKYIIFADPKKPFKRSGKGSIQRASTMQAYKDEIEQLYAAAEQENSNGGVMDTSSPSSVSEGIHNIIVTITRNSNITPQDNIFTMGVDSLGVFAIQRRLRAVLEEKESKDLAMTLTTTIIYTNPTIEMLSKVFYSMLETGKAVQQGSASMNIREMQALINEYTQELPPAATSEAASPSSFTVVLTGSTGSLGTYLLDSLLARPHISKIYCLNRSLDGKTRQTSISSTRGLSTDWLDRVTFLQVDLSKPSFGLSNDDYNTLLRDTTHIIHNQWQVDFNLSLSSFEPHIHGVRKLIDFCASSTHSAKIFFISSVGIALNYFGSAVPETIIDNLSYSTLGYGSSKLVSELILEEATKISGIEAAICRVGQIAGPTKRKEGMWNKQEWFPTIIAASKFLGVVPGNLASLNRIDFIPVDDLSNIILELADLDKIGDAKWKNMKIYHTVNPESRQWEDFVPIVSEALGGLKTVDWEEWINKLKESAERGEIENPGVKLLQFYKGIDAQFKADKESTVFMTDQTLMKSPTLKNLGPVTEEWLKGWLEQWKF